MTAGSTRQAAGGYLREPHAPILVVPPALYIGSLETALEVARRGVLYPIQVIVSLGCGDAVRALEHWTRQAPGRFWYEAPDLKDTPDQDLWPILGETLPLIQSAQRKRHGVLCHCVSGRSRCLAVVCAYLMHSYGHDFAEAEAILKRSGVELDMNPGFVLQLQRWKGGRTAIAKASHGLTYMGLCRAWSSEYALDWKTVEQEARCGSVCACCRWCRVPLFRLAEDVVREDARTFQLYAISWMQQSTEVPGAACGVVQSGGGRLRCPGCSRKLGAFRFEPFRDALFLVEKQVVIVRRQWKPGA